MSDLISNPYVHVGMVHIDELKNAFGGEKWFLGDMQKDIRGFRN